jgi:hypothetical protein
MSKAWLRIDGFTQRSWNRLGKGTFNSLSTCSPHIDSLGQLGTAPLARGFGFGFAADWRGGKRPQFQTAGYFCGLLFGTVEEGNLLARSKNAIPPVFWKFLEAGVLKTRTDASRRKYVALPASSLRLKDMGFGTTLFAASEEVPRPHKQRGRLTI